MDLMEESRSLDGIGSGQFDISAVFEPGNAAEFGMTVGGLTITYNTAAKELRCEDKTAPLSPSDGKIKLRLLVDRLSVEIFANEGRVYMPMRHVLDKEAGGVSVFAKGGKAVLSGVTAHEISSIWE